MLRPRSEEDLSTNKRPRVETLSKLETQIEHAFWTPNENRFKALQNTILNHHCKLQVGEITAVIKYATLYTKHLNNRKQSVPESILNLLNPVIDRALSDFERLYQTNDLPNHSERSNYYFFVYNLGFLIKNNWKIPALSVEMLFNLVSIDNKPDLKLLGNFFHGLGSLANENRIKDTIRTEKLINLVKSLGRIDIPLIANIMYGLGLLANAGCLEGSIQLTTVIELLDQLINSRSHELSNSILRLGQIAKGGCLTGQLPIIYLETLLKKLKKPDCQDIASIIKGMGHLAQGNFLVGPVKTSFLKNLLAQVHRYKNISIAHIIYGLGLLAQADCLEDTFRELDLLSLIEQCDKPCNLDTAEIIYGLGQIAHADYFSETVNITVLTKLLEKFLDEIKSPSEKNLASIIYGLGQLALAGYFSNTINAEKYINIFSNIQTHTARSVATILYGLGLLANAGCLKGSIRTNDLEILLNKLDEGDEQQIANTIYALGQLARAGCLKGVFLMTIFRNLIEKLARYTDQGIANIIYGLGQLSDGGFLNGCLSMAELETMLENFQNATDQHIANVILGCRFLTEKQHLEKINSKIMLLLIDLASRLSRSYQIANTFSISKILHHSLCLLPLSEANKILHHIEQGIKSSYLHPIQAAKLLYSLCVLQEKYNNTATHHYEKMIDALSLPLSTYSIEIQDILLQTLPTLKKAFPEIHATLYQQIYSNNPEKLFALKKNTNVVTPLRKIQHTQQPDKNELQIAKQDVIFNLLSKKDMTGLKNLFNKKIHYTQSTNREPTKLLQTHAKKPKITTDNDRKIRHFFESIPAKVLRHLISNSDHLFLFHVICNASQWHRYELAQRNLIHPVILYLPFNSLEPFITNLQTPGGLYRDHRATLKLTEALLMRAHAEQTETNKEKTRKLAETLLDRALKFHDCRGNDDVCAKLYHCLNNLQLELFEDDTSDQPNKRKQQPVQQELLQQESVIPTKFPKGRFVVRLIQDKSKQNLTAGGNLDKPNDTNESAQQQTAPGREADINKHFQYESEDIDAYLKARIYENGGGSNVYILASTKLHGTLLHHPETGKSYFDHRPVDMIKQFFDKNPQLTKNKNITLLLPIEVNNNHWVGLMLACDLSNNNIKAMYFNSNQNEESDKINIRVLLDSFIKEKTFLAHTKIYNSSCLQQTDSVSCGVFLTENFYCAVNPGRAWDIKIPDLVYHLRSRQLRALKNYDKNLHDKLYEKQRKNLNTVGSLSKQLAYHGLYAIGEKTPTKNGLKTSRESRTEIFTHK